MALNPTARTATLSSVSSLCPIRLLILNVLEPVVILFFFPCLAQMLQNMASPSNDSHGHKVSHLFWNFLSSALAGVEDVSDVLVSSGSFAAFLPSASRSFALSVSYTVAPVFVVTKLESFLWALSNLRAFLGLLSKGQSTENQQSWPPMKNLI